MDTVPAAAAFVRPRPDTAPASETFAIEWRSVTDAAAKVIPANTDI